MWHFKETRTLFFLLMFMITVCGSVYGASSVQYLGPYYYQSSAPGEGTVRVGHFLVDGKLAFCVQHEKDTVPTGTQVTDRIYDDPGFRKALYYGYGGPEQWSGFKDEKHGVGIMSLYLTEINPGSRYQPGHYDSVSGMREFKSFLNSMPDVNTDLRFSPDNIKAYYSREMDMERTPDVKVVGGNKGSISFTLPEGVTLHNNLTGTDAAGEVTLKPGDSFYLKAPPGRKEDKMTVRGKNVRYQPVVFVTGNQTLQNLSNLRPVSVEPETSRLEVQWVGLIDLVIEKRDMDTDVMLEGARFTVHNLSDGRKVPANSVKYTSGPDGKVVIKDVMIPGRNYRVTETDPPDGYMLNKRVADLKIGGDKTEEVAVFHNSAQYVTFRLNKKGKVSWISGGKLHLADKGLEGGKFQIIAQEDGIGQGREDGPLKKGDVAAEVTTDAHGRAVSPKLPEGKYKIVEVETPKGYVKSSYARIIDAEVPDGEDEITETVDIYNDIQERVLRIYKYDSLTARPLAEAVFRITDSKGNSFDVTTDGTGYAVVRELPDGEYTLKEVKAPNGYSLDDQARTFKITRDGKLRDLVIIRVGNRTAGPATGDSQEMMRLYILMGTAGVLTLIAAVMHKRYNVHKQKRN